MKKLFNLLILTIAVIASGCVKDNSGKYDDDSNEGTKRTLFIYMAANNSLSGESASNLNSIKAGVSRSTLNRNRVVIYYARPSEPTQLIELVYDKRFGTSNYVVLKDYGNQSAADPVAYNQAINDMKELAPANNYGMILWSHATGWLPSDAPRDYFILDQSLNRMSDGAENFIRDPYKYVTLTKAFGQHGTQWMELDKVAQATPDNSFEFIIADCCLMGQAEVAYAFRKKAQYFVASPAEVISVGMPYDKIPTIIFSNDNALQMLKNVCEEYNDFYKYYGNPSGSEASWSMRNSATIALYDCSQMEPLANAVALVVNSARNVIPDMSFEGIQVYDRYIKHTSYDIKGVVEKLLPASDPFRLAFEQQLSRTVLYKATTGRMVNLMIDKEKYSGMSMYISVNRYSDLNESYYSTAWGKKIFDRE